MLWYDSWVMWYLTLENLNDRLLVLFKLNNFKFRILDNRLLVWI